MEIPYAAWNEAIPKRHSVRLFEPVPVEGAVLDRLRTVCRDFRPFPEARVELAVEPAEPVLRGLVGAYGKIRHAPAYLAFIGLRESPRVQECVGYTGEGLMLEAASLGLGTCWVGGFFKRGETAARLSLGPQERVYAVSPIGKEAPRLGLLDRLSKAVAGSRARRPLAELLVGGEVREEWMAKALEAARWAPSGVNRQPWRFRIEEGRALVILTERDGGRYSTARLDCGIAMLHFEAAAAAAGIHGTWRFLAAPEVARFMPQ